MINEKEVKILLLDSNSLINRAFHALPPLMIKDGLYTNAIYGYLTMLAKILQEEKPSHVCAVFDCRAKTFRHFLSKDYKATRKPMPEELAMQVPILQDLLKKMGIKILFKEGYEADDILGTLAKRFAFPTIVVTGDRDCLQLVDDTTTVFHTKKGISEVKKYTPDALAAEGFTPEQIIEYKGLAGDSSDNISGCPGVGEKTAKELLAKYGSIDGVYDNIESIQGKLKDKLLTNKDIVYLSKKLATIEVNADVPCSLDEIKYAYALSDDAKEMMRYLQFKNVAEKFDLSPISSTLNTAPMKETAMQSEETESAFSLRKIQSNKEIVADLRRVKEIVDSIKINSAINISFIEDKIVLSTYDNVYEIKTEYGLLLEGISFSDALDALAPLLGKNYNKIFFDAKKTMHTMAEYGMKLEKPYNDVLLMAYLVNNTKVIKTAGQLMEDYGFDSLGTENTILYVYDELLKKIKEKNLSNLYNEIELPLIEVLFEMEQTGFTVDSNVLNSINEQISIEIEKLVQKIYDQAGQTFNINSTKQLAKVLFEDLGLHHSKKTKTGYSVDADTLEELDHPIVNDILRYRELTKLKSTYLDGMKNVMNPITGKVHSCFNQCITATGRLSSTEPNLQNIPVRRAEGREIRKMFIPTNGGKLVSADYSQIELRLLAHFSGDERLIESYRENGDIHALTASKIFNVPIDLVTPEMRSSAKAVNFGIIYGISGFGLAKNANVSRYQAKTFIDQYFKTYPKVKKYMSENVEKAKTQGYLTTLCGRIRYFPELTSSKHNIRAFGERAAMNMPLQGTASDIIKIAMLSVYRELKKRKMNSRLILQVHDELILDVPLAEEEEVKKIVKNCMENAVSLKIPLVVNVASGVNWYEAK